MQGCTLLGCVLYRWERFTCAMLLKSHRHGCCETMRDFDHEKAPRAFWGFIY